MKQMVEIEKGQTLVVKPDCGLTFGPTEMALENFVYATRIPVIMMWNDTPHVIKSKWNPLQSD